MRTKKNVFCFFIGCFAPNRFECGRRFVDLPPKAPLDPHSPTLRYSFFFVFYALPYIPQPAENGVILSRKPGSSLDYSWKTMGGGRGGGARVQGQLKLAGIFKIKRKTSKQLS